MYKRLLSQFILSISILSVSWFTVKAAEINQTIASVPFRAVLENIKYSPFPDGQANNEFLVLDIPDLEIPVLKSETMHVTVKDIFSRKPVNTADGRRVVEYSFLEETRIHLSDEDYEILLKIVEAEAGVEDEIGRMLVAGVVLNRVADDAFPDTVKAVVYQKLNDTYQFSPVGNGRIKTAKVSEGTIVAVDKVLSGIDYTEGALFFASRKYADPNRMKWFDRNLVKLFTHGGHEFFTL